MEAGGTTETIIEPGMGIKHYWRDLWRYRELFYFLAWRDIFVRYKQTTIGIAWSVLRPFLTMIAFTIVFSKLAKLPSDGSTISDPGFRGSSAVAVFFQLAFRGKQLPDC